MRDNSPPEATLNPKTRVPAFAYPLFSTTVFYLAFTAPLSYRHGLWGINLLSLDFLLQLLFALLLFPLSRNKLLFVPLQAAFMALIYLGSPLKIIYFSGDPVTPYDIASAWALLRILDPGTRLLIVLPLVTLSALFLYNLKLTRRRLLPLLLLITLLPLSLKAASPTLTHWFDAGYPTQPWRHGYNYAVRGPSVYLLHETVKMLSEANRVPSAQAVEQAAATLKLHAESPPPTPPATRRNLHLILVESLWDAYQLPSVAKGPDPFDKRFRALWEETGHSTIFSPVYGAGTANAEFELLCGLPVLSDRIVFEHEIRNDTLPCLPRILKRHGYRTVALHPNRKHYWNRAFAYPRLGIDRYFSLPDFTHDDLLGGRFLSDKSLLRQSRKFVQGYRQPLFDYTMTIAGHYPYHLNEQRPSLPLRQSGNEDLDRYLNLIRYSTAELIDHIDTLRREDPDGLIVVLGDHSPFLGPDMEGYRAAGLLPKQRGELGAAAQQRLSATPLIVIDGKQGPLHMGQRNLYELPAQLLILLGLPPTMPFTDKNEMSWSYRPMAGLGVLAWKKNHEAYRCHGANVAPPCREVDAWRESMNTLRLDMLRGAQHLATLLRKPR